MTTGQLSESRERIATLLARRRDYRDEVRALTAKYRYVVFYGCGAILASIVDSWNEQVGRTIDFTCDSDPAKWGQVFCGAKCLSPDELMAIKDDCTVFVTIGEFRPVYDWLLAKGFPSVHQLFKYDLVASDFLPRENPDDLATQAASLRDQLADERSRNVFDAIVDRVLGDGADIDVMRNVCERNQYFPSDIVSLSEHERLVDVGAYNGDTVRDFTARTKGKFDRIHAFELDAINFRAMQENVAKMPERDRISLYNVGAWDSEQDITYSIGKSQSTVGSGEGKGHVAPLDQVLAGEKVTMIKMDIEGAEPHGLRGLARIIREQKPKVAVCLYHDFRHLWEIPLYLKSLCPDYRIFLRHHTNLEYETVCYAIPPAE